MVNIIITAIVVIIGPIAFSTSDESKKASVQTVLRLMNANAYADKKRHNTSVEENIYILSIKTISAPLPKSKTLTPKLKIISQNNNAPV